MSQSPLPSSEQPAQPALSTSAALHASLDGLPEWCSESFRERYRRGEVPQFGCYDSVYLRAPRQQAVTSRTGSGSTTELPASAFFPPFSSLVRQYTRERNRAAAATTHAEQSEEGEAEAPEEVGGPAFGRTRPSHSWEHITRAEDLWNGPPLTTKIPPASDYERILLDRA